MGRSLVHIPTKAEQKAIRDAKRREKKGEIIDWEALFAQFPRRSRP